MSTKIYNGYRLKNISTIEELFSFTRKAKDSLELASKTLQKQSIIRMATSLFDEFLIGHNDFMDMRSEDPHALSFFSISSNFVEKQFQEIYKTHKRNPNFDFGVSFAISHANGKILVRLFDDNKELKSVWESFEEVEYYGFWDNTDALEDVSEEEWVQRGLDWNATMSDDWKIHHMNIDCVETNYLSVSFEFEEEDFINLCHSKEKRVEDLALKIYLKEKVKTLSSNYVDNFFKAKNLFKEDPEAEKIKEKLFSVLPDITSKELYQKFAEVKPIAL